MKRKKKNSRYHFVQIYEMVKIQMHFRSNYLIFWFKFFYKCVDFGEFFKNEIYLFFIWTKHEKNNNGKSWVFLYGRNDGVK